MGRLCIYLPPFASDYSGACSTLFDLHCLTAINDASCCTSHYVHCDEPRWGHEARPVVCTKLRNTDAILGTDEKVVNRICEAAERIAPPLIAIVGTPVPAIIGMDTSGIACEIEAATGIPALGFDTTGFDWYDKGIVMAGKALIDRFAEEPERSQRPVPGKVNIIGMTPLDLGDVGNDGYLVSLLESEGVEVGARFFMGLSMDQIAHCGDAALNLAVSSSGVVLAEHMQDRFGTPYMTGFPVGGAQTRAWMERVKAALAGEEGPSGQQRCFVDEAAHAVRPFGPGRILVVADQVMGDSIREKLELEGEDRPIDVASFFTWHKALARPGDVALSSEASYLRVLKAGEHSTIIADPLLCDVPFAEEMEKIEFVHPAVSGKLYWDRVKRMLSPGRVDPSGAIR